MGVRCPLAAPPLRAASAADLLPRARRGNSSSLVMGGVSHQKHSCLSCGILVLAFSLFKFALDLPLSFAVCYLMSSSLSHPQLLCDSNPLPSPSPFACTWTALLQLPGGAILFFLLASFPSPCLERVGNMTAALFISSIIYMWGIVARVELLAQLRGKAICVSSDSHFL